MMLGILTRQWERTPCPNLVPPTQVMQISGQKNNQSINNYSSASIEQQKQMSKILCDIATGNDDTPVNDENTSVFNIPDACDDMYHTVENLQNFQMPQLCHSNYKGKPVSMFQGATITGNVTITIS